MGHRAEASLDSRRRRGRPGRWGGGLAALRSSPRGARGRLKQVVVRLGCSPLPGAAVSPPEGKGEGKGGHGDRLARGLGCKGRRQPRRAPSSHHPADGRGGVLRAGPREGSEPGRMHRTHSPARAQCRGRKGRRRGFVSAEKMARGRRAGRNLLRSGRSSSLEPPAQPAPTTPIAPWHRPAVKWQARRGRPRPVSGGCCRGRAPAEPPARP